ncbi:hypothetical protein FSB78_07945 [Sphingomonas ginsenosidivorax]|uniref:Uncharacterized protein n=1 Tax=Sphingomonas ginsenosidivorax TaxID=862135 RepID=A0A5C6UF81_9SPHN|nr:hypothetical protein [Sphingomonas ginsenosidivorax]TXC70881.1 hypothetical protein FSB78_07945 [Sphingomonas ginsenosidivorax]
MRVTAVVLLLVPGACAPRYTLVSPGTVAVAKRSLHVRPGIAWNRIPRGKHDSPWEERWTQNGDTLDTIAFLGGLPDGRAMVRQRHRADRKVPVFRATMSPEDLVAMIESYYRIRAGAVLFETRAVVPVRFVGTAGLQLDFAYVGADEVRRRGRAVLAVVDARFYCASLDGAALHYFDAALPEFDAIARSATR